MGYFRKYINIIMFFTGMIIVAMLSTQCATTHFPKVDGLEKPNGVEFCEDNLKWQDANGNIILKPIVVPCHLGKFSDDITMTLGWANDCVIAIGSLDRHGRVMYIVFFEVNKAAHHKSKMIAIMENDTVYMYLYGETTEPMVGTVEQFKEIIDLWDCKKISVEGR